MNSSVALILALTLLTTLPFRGGAQTSAVRTSDDAERVVIEKGPNHRIVGIARRILAPDGKESFRTNTWTELETGMHYLQDGQWLEAKEEIEVFPDGAIARKGVHKVIFAPNINSRGAIQIELPDGQLLKSQVIGLSYIDSTSGKSVWIAQVKDSIGVVTGNQVVYEDCFDGIKADLRYTYRKGSFEQDVILLRLVQ